MFFTDKFSCEDIDECSDEESHVCPDHSYCKNTDGSYTCVCEFGFRMNEETGECDGKWERCFTGAKYRTNTVAYNLCLPGILFHFFSYRKLKNFHLL